MAYLRSGKPFKALYKTDMSQQRFKKRFLTAVNCMKHSGDRSSPTAHDRSHSRTTNGRVSVTSRGSNQRTSSVMKAAEVARIADVPIILFMGGPGGGKTRHAARVRDALEEKGLVHICMPDMIRSAISKYKDRFPEWKEAAERYERGELIPNNLALALVKAEMGRHPNARAFFLEGFPREARQVEDFERQVKNVNMALILDYDEQTLRHHMEKRGLTVDIIDQRIKEFKQKTLPSAKYFDDQKLLHLIPGEKGDQEVYERMKSLVERAMDSDSPVINSAATTPHPDHDSGRNSRVSTARSAVARKASPAASKAASPPIASTPKAPTPPAQTNEIVEDAVAAIHNVPVAATPPVASPVAVATPHVASKTPSPPLAKNPTPPPGLKTPSPPLKTPTPPKTPSPKTPTASVPQTPQTTVPTPFSPNVDSSGHTFQKGLPNNAPVIVIIGAPGSNKVTFAQKIAKKYEGFVYLSMGEILRRKVQQNPDDELWQRIGKKMAVGDVVPMKICRELLYQAIHDMGNKSWGYVVEGYPRTQAQLTDFESQVERLDVALLIDCTEQFCIDNIKKRVQESKENIDARPDDNDDVVKTRMALFKQNALPMLKTIDDKNKLRVIDGDRDEETIFKEVISAIDNAVFIEDNGSGKSLSSSKNGSLEEAPAQ
ncbi:hypothetical protein L596_019888 [Steinernema carpocapsae]|uniref:Adenylate kinase isoenzyme 5 n=1 Tax=Steinernema carpocapsae TaxID=34508 RepID=A0A4U5MRX1_STECR|nr:hypothetical protein L596_019888 [Steinernema carpocapsae]